MMGRGEEGGIRTVECLRGRLQAERAASKAATEQADLISKRLDEIHKQLAEEIKCRDRAERRLRHALKRLKSLKLLDFNSEGSVSSSDSRTAGGKDCSSIGPGNRRGLRMERSWSSSVGTGCSWSKEGGAPADEDSSSRDREESSSNGSSLRQDSNNVIEQDDASQHSEESEHSENKFALVPVKTANISTGTCRSDVNEDNVQNVLDALRRIKEQLQSSLERRGAASSYPRAVYGR